MRCLSAQYFENIQFEQHQYFHIIANLAGLVLRARESGKIGKSLNYGLFRAGGC